VYIYIEHTNYNKIIESLEERLKAVKSPEFYFVFFTESVYPIYLRIVEYLRKKYPDSEMVGFFVGGFVTKSGVWSKGLALLFVDNANLHVVKGKNVHETFDTLSASVGSKFSMVIAPLVKFGSTLSVCKFWLVNNYVWWLKYKMNKKKTLKEVSHRLERLIYPPNVALSKFKGEVVGLHLVPLRTKANTPIILTNYKDEGRVAVAVKLRGKAKYYDVFPERGKSFEETVEIINDYFTTPIKVKTVKEGLAIGEVNGLPAVEFLKKVRHVHLYNEETVKSQFESGKLKMVTPYGLAYVSKKTHGCSILGLLPYPLKIYPSVVDLTDFYDEAVFVGEYLRGGIQAYESTIEKMECKDFGLFLIDANVIPMFAGQCIKLKRAIESKCEEFLGLFVKDIAYKGKAEGRLFSEIDNGLYYMTSGTFTVIDLKL